MQSQPLIHNFRTMSIACSLCQQGGIFVISVLKCLNYIQNPLERFQLLLYNSANLQLLLYNNSNLQKSIKIVIHLLTRDCRFFTDLLFDFEQSPPAESSPSAAAEIRRLTTQYNSTTAPTAVSTSDFNSKSKVSTRGTDRSLVLRLIGKNGDQWVQRPLSRRIPAEFSDHPEADRLRITSHRASNSSRKVY